MRRWCCVIRHRAICRAYTQGALFYAKVKIARSNISRGRQSLTREQKLERFPLEFFAEQITSGFVAAHRHNQKEHGMMSLFRNTIVGVAIGAGAFAFSASNASAYIVCNDTSACWHTHNPYDYPPEAHVTVHENEWHWGANEHYTFREHAGRGYWSGDNWIDW